MPAITLTVGSLLVVLTGVLYVLRDPTKSVVTAFIPAILGILLIALAIVARKQALRKHAMHAALGLALLGLLAAGGRLGMVLATGKPFGLAALGVTVMSAICVVYLALGVRSFVAARSRDKATAPAQA